MKRFYLLLLIAFFACTKDFEELNKNPTSPPSMNPDLLFTYSVKSSMGAYPENIIMHQRGIMQWIMFNATYGGVEEGKEYYLPATKDALWARLYTDGLMNAQDVIDLTKDEPLLLNKTSIARIRKVFLFLKVVDLWGDIPYSHALKGTTEYILNPKYDLQESIYLGLLDELKSAAQNLNAAKESFGSADPIFMGNIEGWKKFANSLRFRIAIRIGAKRPDISQQVIADLSSVALISSNNENALFNFTSDFENFLYLNYSKSEHFEIFCLPSKFLVDLLVNSNDPRVKVFFTPAPVPLYGYYCGVPNLLKTDDPVWSNFLGPGVDLSGVGNWFLRSNTPDVLLSYSEVCFLKAEAALNGWWQGNAQNLYEEGIRANMEFYKDSANNSYISNNEIISYLASVPPVNLENIITQKWISFVFMNSFEAYAEYRRTGFPVLKDYNGAPINTTHFPKRFTYPANEMSYNRANLMEAINRMGGSDNPQIPLWWDAN